MAFTAPTIDVSGFFEMIVGFLSNLLGMFKDWMLGMMPPYGEVLLLGLAFIGAWALVRRVLKPATLIIIVGVIIYLAIRFSGG